MVGFIPEPPIDEDSKLKIPKDPVDFIDPKTNGLSFADSFLDFDSIKEWFEDNPNLDRIDLEESEFGGVKRSMEMGKEDSFEKTHVSDRSISAPEPNVDGFKSIVNGSELVGGELGFKVKVEEEEFDGLEPIVIGSELVGGESGFTVKVEEEEFDGFKPIVNRYELVGGGSGFTVKVEEEESKPDGKLVSSIGEEMGKVSLVGGLESGSSSSEESESESSSSSSSSSNSSYDVDEEEEEELGENKEKVKVEIKREVDGAGELEEGEIGSIDGEVAYGGTDNLDDDEEDEETEEICSGFGFEFDEVDDGDDEDDDDGAMRGPIRTKNEFEVLPPVPPLDVTLQPHHQMLPVGIVLSIIGTKVIVEGREQHNPLNEGSILWITIGRSPLGFVDEIFGPVKNPYYAVRYNSESEVPGGIHVGTSISFVPEFANHVLNDKNLHKKGYDASGENDEELSDDTEFSDDEKEAEYKKMQKMKRRGMNDQRVGNWKSNKKKVNSRNGAWKNGRNLAQQTSTAVDQLPPNQNQHNFSAVSASWDNNICSSSIVGKQNFVGGSGFVPPFSVMPHSSGSTTPLNGVWTNGMPGQQLQNAIFSNRFPAESMPLLSQNYQQQPIPFPTPAMPMPTMIPCQQQQFDPSLSTFANVVSPGGQPNLFAGPACAPWLGIGVQNGFGPNTFGAGMQGQQLLNAVGGILANGPTIDGNSNFQPKGVLGNFETSQNFNMGASSSRGKKRYHRGRGRGRFTGGRGHQQS